MSGNELGDGVRNFVLQDHLFQGQQQSHVPEGNWHIINSSFPGGTGSGESPFFLTHGSPFIQSGVRPTEQSIMNGFVYGNQSHQTMQNAANSDQRHFTSSGGLSFHELQQHGPDHITNASVSSEASASPVSFDLYGGQHQLSHQQSNMPQFLQPRQSVINDPQQVQQQLMIRKFQELQKQQLDSRLDYSINQAPTFAKQSSGSQSAWGNATSNSNNFQNPLLADYDSNWAHQGPPSLQVSSNELAIQLNTGQPQSSVNLIPQQFDNSLYGLHDTQYPQMMADRYLLPQPQLTIAGSNYLHGNQNHSLTDRVGIPDGSSVFRHKFNSQNNLELESKQSVNMGLKSSIINQQVNSMSRNLEQQTLFTGNQELTFQSETSFAKPSGQGSPPKNEVALDPEEEKILYGSDDNIWAAFGSAPHNTGDPGLMIGNGGLFDGLPSIQSGSWSALMQSAVAESSSDDVILPDRSSKFLHSNEDGLSARRMSSRHNDLAEKENSTSDTNVRLQSTLNSGSFAADNVETANSMVFNLSGSTIQHEPGHGVHTHSPYTSVQPLKEVGRRFFSNPLKMSVASQHHIQPESDTKTIMSGQHHNNSSWNDEAATPPGIDKFNNPNVSLSHAYVDSATFHRAQVEHHQVSSQITQTWFSAHGTSKSGQMLQIHDAQKLSPIPLGKSTIGSISYMLNSEEKGTDGTSSASVVNGHGSSSLPQQNVTGQNLVPLQQKKRKNAAFGLQPWHKEISDDSHVPGILSMAETDSSKAANRVDAVAETTQDANPVLRSKTRLLMSSHLVQQLIQPTPPVIPLSADASTSYDIFAYSISRTALGNACHAVSDSSNLDKRKSTIKTSAQGYEKTAQELMGKVTKLENELSRKEKTVSILDLKIECQELEKFAIINRFARFHGRPKNDSSSLANATVNTQKFLPQRYVNPVAM